MKTYCILMILNFYCIHNMSVINYINFLVWVKELLDYFSFL